MWYVYIIRTEKNRLYTGIARDPEERFMQHLTGKAPGAKFFRSDIPIELVWWEEHPDRSSASVREYEIKQFSRKKKESLISPTD